MNILEAIKSGKKFTGSIVKERGAKYWELNKYGIISDRGYSPIMDKRLLEAEDYELYNPEPQIVPKEIPEIWQSGELIYYTYKYSSSHGLKFINQAGFSYDFNKDFTHPPIHGQNGWKRLYPEVPSKNKGENIIWKLQ